MGRPMAKNTNVINHFSHLHPLQLTPPSSAPSPPCSACKIAGGNGRMYSCRPCNFYLHESCSKMRQVITHPSHPYHKLNLLVAPVYDGGFFNCDACGIIGTGFSYQCSQCDFDIHAQCAYKPLSVIHKSHPQHNLQLAFQTPYGAKGFSCDVCGKIGKNQWLYRCVPCEFDGHVGCISFASPSRPHVHTSNCSSSATTNQNPNYNGLWTSRPGPRPRPAPRPGPRPGPGPRPIVNNQVPYGPRPLPPRQMENPRPIIQRPGIYGPRIMANESNGYFRPIGNSTPTSQNLAGYGQNDPAGQGFGGSTNQSGYNGEEGNKEFNGKDDFESGNIGNAYEGANEEGEEEFDREEPESVTHGDDYSQSEIFESSSDARSQYNDQSDGDLYPYPLDDTEGPIETNQASHDYGNSDYEAEGDFEDDNCDEAEGDYGEMTYESGSMYEEEESYGGMDDSDSQYAGGSDESNMFAPMAGLVGAMVGLGMNNTNSNQYGQGQAVRPTNMNQGRVAHLRATGRRVPRYMPDGGGNGPNGGGNGSYGGGNGSYGGVNGPNGGGYGPNGGGNGVNGVGNTMMNVMVQGMFKDLAVNMLVGGGGGGGGSGGGIVDIIGGSGDGGGSSILGGLLGGESESQY